MEKKKMLAFKGHRQIEKPCFFKPFLPDFPLEIPKTFLLRHLAFGKCKVGQEVTLKNHLRKGRSWPVKLKGFCFKEGWSDFVRDHGLCVGDFLVFKHEGSMVFNVMVLDHSACEKTKYPARDVDIDDNKRVQWRKFIDWTATSSNTGGASVKMNGKIESTDQSFEKTLTAFNFEYHCVYVPKHIAKLNGLNEKCCKTLMLTDRKGIPWQMELKHRTSDDQFNISGDWASICTSNGLKVGDACTLKLTSYKGNQKIMGLSLI